jgi:hypothetical protein
MLENPASSGIFFWRDKVEIEVEVKVEQISLYRHNATIHRLYLLCCRIELDLAVIAM